MPEHILDQACIRETEKTLKAGNGTTIPTIGEVTVPISIGEFVTEVTASVSKHVSEPMLGIDFLIQNGAVWDFNNSLIRIGDRTFFLRPWQDKHQWCRRVVLQEEVVVPARSEMNVPTEVQVRTLPMIKEDGNWSTEPTPIRAGLHVSRTHGLTFPSE